MELNKKKVLVGISGGVDSSVSALLLKKQGYEVIGITLKLMQPEKEIEDAVKICKKLDIPHYVLDEASCFNEKVIKNFVSEYKNGRTPNPCLLCNKYMKWGKMLKKADELGTFYIATGHYAKKVEANGKFTLRETTDGKDQTYALYMLGQPELTRTLMPLSDYNKEEVRKIALKEGLLTAEKADSQDICFVPDGDYVSFLIQNGVKSLPGNFTDESGKILGRHKGIINYTVGQRRGLNISAPKSLYVLSLDTENNNVILGYKESTLGSELICDNVNWILGKPEKEIELKAKIRYNHSGEIAMVYPLSDSRARVVFKNPVSSITPGQSVVFYLENMLYGGGIIL